MHDSLIIPKHPLPLKNRIKTKKCRDFFAGANEQIKKIDTNFTPISINLRLSLRNFCVGVSL